MAIPVISILTIYLTLFYTGMIIFLRVGWGKIAEFRGASKVATTSVSILIAARNEADKIEKTIVDILAQDYPVGLFELIVVDDNSTDNTAGIVSKYSTQGVKLIQLDDHEKLNSYKKKAITEAIALADGELIITTDADCRMGTAWLKTIVAFYESGNYKMISSPVVFFEEKSMFEEIQTLEFLFLIGLGAAGIGNKMPSTCNGANLAYRRDIFLELKGFKGIDDLASGDDELFLHKVASAYPDGVGFCKSRGAIVYTHAKQTIGEFIQQRKRWASKSTKYKNKSIVFLGASVWLFNLMFIVNFVGGFFDSGLWLLAISSLVLKVVAELVFLYTVCDFAGRKKLVFYQPFSSIIHIFYVVYIGIAGNSGKYNWKGRMVR